ncbi:hypothetical protein GCM10009664_41290 [Kitasatospora gansuensis]
MRPGRAAATADRPQSPRETAARRRRRRRRRLPVAVAGATSAAAAPAQAAAAVPLGAPQQLTHPDGHPRHHPHPAGTAAVGPHHAPAPAEGQHHDTEHQESHRPTLDSFVRDPPILAERGRLPLIPTGTKRFPVTGRSHCAARRSGSCEPAHSGRGTYCRR